MPPAVPPGAGDGPDVPLGASWDGERTSFLVWAPRADDVEVLLEEPVEGTPAAQRSTRGDDAEVARLPLERDEDGYHRGTTDDAPPGRRYRYRLHRQGEQPVDRPDPASRWQPNGVQGASAVDDPDVAWSDHTFTAPPLHRQVLYELHVGTFSEAGTFDGVIDHLSELAELGVTTIELLPVAQFPGARNWGYDGVLPYAVQDSYGGPSGLRRLVDAAHAHGLAVVLDVVYNHLGPEGNHLDDFGPYFTDRTSTPWGPALNADGPGADSVRRFVVDNAVRWVEEFHIDGLRLDAVHAIVDQSARHLLEELAEAVHAAGHRGGRAVHVVAESDLCDARLLRSPAVGGYGLDGQWADDFHHAVHVALTGEREGYYADYRGLTDLPRMVRDRYVYADRYSPSRRRTVGRPAPDVAYDRFVVCIQNHDQVGNRAQGERLGHLVDHEARKLAATALLTSPFVPLLFMGEEYADPSPFLFFTSHTDPDLAAAVTEGRRLEFAGFSQFAGDVPDPQDPRTFTRSVLDRSVRDHGEHAALQRLYRDLLHLRHCEPLITDPNAPDVEPTLVPGDHTIVLRRRTERGGLLTALHVGDAPVDVQVADAPGSWTPLLDTTAAAYAADAPASTGPTEDGKAVHRQAAHGTLLLTLPPHAAVMLRQET